MYTCFQMAFSNRCYDELMKHIQECHLYSNHKTTILNRLEECIHKNPKDEGKCYFKARSNVIVYCNIGEVKERPPHHSIIRI